MNLYKQKKKIIRFVCIHIFTIAQSTVRPDFNIGYLIHFSDEKKKHYTMNKDF